MSAESGLSPARIVAFSIAALVVPFLVVAVVVAISRMLPLQHEDSVAFLALPLSIAAGVYCLWQLPLSRTWHAIGTMGYVAAGSFGGDKGMSTIWKKCLRCAAEMPRFAQCGR